MNEQRLKRLVDDLELKLIQGAGLKPGERTRKLEEDLHPFDFNLTVSNTNGTKTRFGNFVGPASASRTGTKVLQETHSPEDPLRKSVLVIDHSKEYENRRKLIKSVLQRMPTGNVYQKVNDLIDAAIIMFSKRLDYDMAKALQELNNLILNLDDKLPIDTLENLIKQASTSSRQRETEGVSQTLADLEKVFINGMYDFMPEYLERNKIVRIGATDPSRPSADSVGSAELNRLKQDNERLKQEVASLKDKKANLQRISR